MHMNIESEMNVISYAFDETIFVFLRDNECHKYRMKENIGMIIDVTAENMPTSECYL